MRRCVFDSEADGLMDTVTKVHCAVFKDIDTKEVFRFYDEPVVEDVKDTDMPLEYMVNLVNDCSLLIGHNVLGYDYDLLEYFYGVKFNCSTIDTLVWSQTLNPDRQLPKGCPTSVLNPLTGKLDKVTPHSIAAWGYRVGRHKPKHFDWGSFSSAMLHRCSEDTEIQYLVFLELLKEAGMEGINIEELESYFLPL